TRTGTRLSLSCNEAFEGNVPDAVPWNVHGCERGGTEFRQPDVVKAGDRDLLRHLDIAFAKIAQHSDRHEVVYANDCCGVIGGTEQLMRSMPPSFQSVFGSNGSYRLATEFANRFEERLPAIVDWSQCRVMTEKRHSPMSNTVEILNDPVHAFAVINADVRNVLRCRTDVIKNCRNMAVDDEPDQISVHLGDNGCETSDAPSNHQTNAGE